MMISSEYSQWVQQKPYGPSALSFFLQSCGHCGWKPEGRRLGAQLLLANQSNEPAQKRWTIKSNLGIFQIHHSLLQNICKRSNCCLPRSFHNAFAKLKKTKGPQTVARYFDALGQDELWPGAGPSCENGLIKRAMQEIHCRFGLIWIDLG